MARTMKVSNIQVSRTQLRKVFMAISSEVLLRTASILGLRRQSSSSRDCFTFARYRDIG
jgi:hypothetical protein